MKDKTKLSFNVSEMSSLWTQYINDSVIICTCGYFLEKVEDEEIQPIIEKVFRIAKQNLTFLKDLFQKEGFPVPQGFTEEDVNYNAPRLFSDTFALTYIKNLSMLSLLANATALGLVTRPDVVAFHENMLKEAVSVHSETRELLLKQGTYVKPPYIPIPDKVGFVTKQNFLDGLVGKKRPLTSIEISHLYFNVQTNAFGKAMIIGLAQTSQDQRVKKLLLRGKDISQKHLELFRDILQGENLPAPSGWDATVMDSTTQVFSDKLTLFHVGAMIAAGVGNYGTAMAASPRKDIALKYASLIPEISTYAEEIAEFLIDKGWMEEPPMSCNRDELIKEGKKE
ncbi:hypothetical protein GCM10008967_35960 [Bacillus carboniphilus]|uniref:DUF3231 family protein n=1 Tax=Bacillus carboniphilus TaxID=86663 RepID=A0ABP3GFD5_9BACI